MKTVSYTPDTAFLIIGLLPIQIIQDQKLANGQLSGKEANELCNGCKPGRGRCEGEREENKILSFITLALRVFGKLIL